MNTAVQIVLALVPTVSSVLADLQQTSPVRVLVENETAAAEAGDLYVPVVVPEIQTPPTRERQRPQPAASDA